ncbi:MAG TPA: lytic polysaccharide monooxygenase auxiliary activity family 9 protein [Oligoflexus sp.]|uniref:lytic polysaccharide monooxygenase auxiliary activity family 9 protein n=1 Tax=Oligoflexus sp. TaxID=1971216 RepID=UPI002D805192|nr:lytic polysaccharide monooxygenase auxiliary activity family 9 protein [Oligoflexus sp.]HET9241150.1 lytic polysaccharide monooxygenase auxiliary activity family 9 protein [Oligoflexus sp.]
MRSGRLNVSLKIMLGGAFMLAAAKAAAHGWITSPASRQEHCARGTTAFDCGPLQYEPQSVEAPKGALSCSGGSMYSVLDGTGPWPVTQVGSSATFVWKLTAPHRTQSWEYFLNGTRLAFVDGAQAMPGREVAHTLHNLPSGRHTLLARWNIGDTPMAFYSCVDIMVAD